MNVMKFPDGPGWSPDGGGYTVRGDVLTWDDGDVWDMRDGGMIRTMPLDAKPLRTIWDGNKYTQDSKQ